MSETLPAFLKTVPIFSGLKEADLEALAKRFNMRVYDPGEVIIRQGETSDNLFVIYSGSVDVSRGPTPEKQVVLTQIGRAESFGEAALFHNVKRIATVTARETTEALVIGKIIFMQYLHSHESSGIRVLYEMMKFLLLRLEATSTELQNERAAALQAAEKNVDHILPV